VKLRAALRRVARNHRLVAGIAILGVFIGMAIFAPFLSPYKPHQVVGPAYGPPSAKDWLGTDELGADVLSQVIYGSRVSLEVGFTVALVATLLGSAVGLVSGFYRGAADEGLMRITDVFLILPSLPLAIILAAYLGPSETTIIEVLAVTAWPLVARVVRSQTLSLRERPFTDAARVIGASNTRIMFRVIIPNLLTLIAANAVLTITAAVVGEAGLDFIGLGNPSVVSWGTMLYWAQNTSALLNGAWWWVLAPGICISLVGLGAVLISVSLEDLFNPRLRSR
jgi:peptide/nickel transport system permease protein